MQPACACARIPGRNCRGKHGIIYSLGCDFHFLCRPLCPYIYTIFIYIYIHRTTKLSQPFVPFCWFRSMSSLSLQFDFSFFYYLKTNRKKKSINGIWTSRAVYDEHYVHTGLHVHISDVFWISISNQISKSRYKYLIKTYCRYIICQ